MAGIYVHVPYCSSRCYYCDFYSSTYGGNRKGYLVAVKKELFSRRDYLRGDVVRTLYFGGGTPSQLEVSDINEIIYFILENFPCELEEVTLEANPEDLTEDYLSDLRKTLVNRLSIGIQSFDDEDLKRINRRHSAQSAIEAVHRAQSLGFGNISVDLIYGLPFQTIEKWQYNLDKVIELGVPHISAYHLTYEEGTMLTKKKDKGEWNECDEEESLSFFKLLRSRLSDAGILPYEISNFARPGMESKHNSSYWKQVHYLGVGPSAHSFDGVSRQWNVANIRTYLSKIEKGEVYYEKEELDEVSIYNEYVMTSLRRSMGIEKSHLLTFSTQLQCYFNSSVQTFFKSGHLLDNEDCIYLSEEGIFISDYIIEALLWVD